MDSKSKISFKKKHQICIDQINLISKIIDQKEVTRTKRNLIEMKMVTLLIRIFIDLTIKRQIRFPISMGNRCILMNGKQ